MASVLRAAVLHILVLTAGFSEYFVIPIEHKIKHIVTVAKSGAAFTDIQSALDSITDANGSNRYLVFVGPGVYDVAASIQLKAYVTLKGSGEESTLIKGAISGGGSSTSHIIFGEDNATITDLSIKNMGGSLHSVGILNDAASPTIKRVTVVARNGTYATTGIHNKNGSSPVLSDLTVLSAGSAGSSYGINNDDASNPVLTRATSTASGAVYNTGIRNAGSNPALTDVVAEALDGSSFNTGIHNYISSPVLRNVKATARGGSAAKGISNNAGSNPVMTYVLARAKNGTDNWGVYNDTLQDSPVIRYGVLTGDTKDVRGGTPVCVYSVGSDNAELNATCK